MKYLQIQFKLTDKVEKIQGSGWYASRVELEDLDVDDLLKNVKIGIIKAVKEFKD